MTSQGLISITSISLIALPLRSITAERRHTARRIVPDFLKIQLDRSDHA